MKAKTKKIIGNLLIVGIILLIVIIFSVFYLNKVLSDKQKNEQVKDTNTTEKVDEPKDEGPQTLSEEQLEEISNQLNTAKDNPFIVSTYETVEDIKLSEILYNGAGISSSQITDKEKMELVNQIRKLQMSSSKPPIYTENEIQAFLSGNVLKVKREDIEKYMLEKTEKAITVSKEEEEIGLYIEEQDSYYITKTNTNFKPIFCDEGIITSEGIYQIKYHNLMDEETKETYTVQMKKVNDQFVFISNLKNEE